MNRLFFITLVFWVLPVVVQAEGRNPFQGAVPVKQFSFETDEDRDFDQLPDDWTRRRGVGFPHYIKAFIDRKEGQHGKQSLRFDVNGGRVIMYSHPVFIDDLHSFVFEGYIRTKQLKNDAALISVSFLNHKRQRLQRFLSKPVSGTHKKWVKVRIGPIIPQKNVRFVVIGCHLVHEKKMDIQGTAWFDNLAIAQLPRMSLDSDFHSHFVKPGTGIQIKCRYSGLQQKSKYQLHLQMIDSSNKIIQKKVYSVTSSSSSNKTLENKKSSVAATGKSLVWKLPPQQYGFYRIRAQLKRERVAILEKETSFAVMDIAKQELRGEFGWSVASGKEEMSATELANVASQAGINWMKYPLWQSALSSDRQVIARTSMLLDRLSQNHITPVGLLNQPASMLRSKFAKDWTGISEIFTMTPSFWTPLIDPVVAKYSSSVQYWQLGDESDHSFVGLKRLPQTLKNVKKQFDRIGRNTRIGVSWDWNSPLPKYREIPYSFLSISGHNGEKTSSPLSATNLKKKLAETKDSGVPRWVVLRPLGKSKFSQEERGTNLVKRMVAAKIGGADAIYAANVFDPEVGMMQLDGAPTLLFLPWRTTALALRGAEYLGSFNLPNQSTNYCFARRGEMVMVIWNREPTTEEIYLGEQVNVTDVWGRQRALPLDSKTGRQTVQVGPTPLVIRGCSEAVARWRIAMQFQKGRLRSQTGQQQEAIIGKNFFTQGISGTARLNIPKEWGVGPSHWEFQLAANQKLKLPMDITLPPNASLGKQPVSIDFNIQADRRYRFRVYRHIEIGLGDVLVKVTEKILPDGSLEVEQIITNNTSPVETLNFRCSLFVPGHQRKKQFVTKLKKGKDKKSYRIPNAQMLKGKELWLRAEEMDGRRVLNYRWRVGENEDNDS
ncbi:hypothetical protein MNBD_PLANCTO02-2077 [hydrothermal vent metagenome]|uniref:Uncharacterized protein n=1 Tax=hydrothermal vent metagenome TaxID=652676 RepID=A0A3B1DYR6_9ZZZZ